MKVKNLIKLINYNEKIKKIEKIEKSKNSNYSH